MVFAIELLAEMKNIFIGVSKQPSLLWQIAPLIVLWVLLEIYFGRYNKEKLGWNTALGNGISMVWIVLSALQFTFSNQQSLRVTWPLFVSLFLIAGYALLIVVVSFKHSLKSKWVYLIASPSPVYYFSIISLMIAHQVILLHFVSIVAIFVIFIFLMLVFFVLRLLIPNKTDSDEDDFDSSFKFEDKKSKQKENFSDTSFPSDLESELDSTFSSNTDPFSNDFASTASKEDVLLKKDPLNPDKPPLF